MISSYQLLRELGFAQYTAMARFTYDRENTSLGAEKLAEMVRAIPGSTRVTTVSLDKENGVAIFQVKLISAKTPKAAFVSFKENALRKFKGMLLKVEIGAGTIEKKGDFILKEEKQPSHLSQYLDQLIEEGLLLEVSYDKLKEDFVDSGKLPEELFERIKATFPNSAYGTWMCVRIADEIVNPDNIDLWKERFEFFERQKQKFGPEFKNIAQIKTREQIEAWLEELNRVKEIVDKKNKGGEKKASFVDQFEIGKCEVPGIKDSKIVYYVFKVPQTSDMTHEESENLWKNLERVVGGGSNWCTVARFSYFSSYTSQGPLYIFVNKNNLDEKYQFAPHRNEFRDQNNVDISGNFYYADFLQFLANKNEITLDARQHAGLTRIQQARDKANTYMESWVDNLKDFSKNDAGRYQVVPHLYRIPENKWEAEALFRTLGIIPQAVHRTRSMVATTRFMEEDSAKFILIWGRIKALIDPNRRGNIGITGVSDDLTSGAASVVWTPLADWKPEFGGDYPPVITRVVDSEDKFNQLKAIFARLGWDEKKCMPVELAVKFDASLPGLDSFPVYDNILPETKIYDFTDADKDGRRAATELGISDSNSFVGKSIVVFKSTNGSEYPECWNISFYNDLMSRPISVARYLPNIILKQNATNVLPILDTLNEHLKVKIKIRDDFRTWIQGASVELPTPSESTQVLKLESEEQVSALYFKKGLDLHRLGDTQAWEFPILVYETTRGGYPIYWVHDNQEFKGCIKFLGSSGNRTSSLYDVVYSSRRQVARGSYRVSCPKYINTKFEIELGRQQARQPRQRRVQNPDQQPQQDVAPQNLEALNQYRVESTHASQIYRVPVENVAEVAQNLGFTNLFTRVNPTVANVTQVYFYRITQNRRNSRAQWAAIVCRNNENTCVAGLPDNPTLGTAALNSGNGRFQRLYGTLDNSTKSFGQCTDICQEFHIPLPPSLAGWIAYREARRQALAETFLRF